MPGKQTSKKVFFFTEQDKKSEMSLIIEIQGFSYSTVFIYLSKNNTHCNQYKHDDVMI